MSGLHAQPKEKPKQVIAELDDLFTEHGIASHRGEPIR